MFSQTNVSSLRIKEQLLVDSGSYRDTSLEIYFSLDTTRRRRRRAFRNKLANSMILASSPFALLSCKRSFRDTLPLEEMDSTEIRPLNMMTWNFIALLPNLNSNCSIRYCEWRWLRRRNKFSCYFNTYSNFFHRQYLK